jgi:uncharacterized protein (DUF1778 family)
MSKLSNAARRSLSFPLRLREREGKLIESAAEALGVSKSEFMRDAVLARAREVVTQTEPVQVP